jgi:tetratricopeptide (TPR) repeat protein
MDNGFIGILKQLVAEQTKVALTDAKKCKAFLADYTRNEYKKESRLHVQAVEAGVAKKIDGAGDLEACKKAQIRELEEEYDLKPVTAADIVNTLALVLRGDTTVTVSPSFEAPAAPVQPAPTPEKAEDAQTLTKKGLDAHDHGDFAEAVKYFGKAAEQGYAAAQNNLGYCYYFGEGVAQDYAKAVEWYRKAADQGYEQALKALDMFKNAGLI